jgi:hypothetical protein
MTKDNSQVADIISVDIESAPTKPSFPCGECGAETKGHHPILDKDTGEVVTKRRICSRRDCRCVVEGS